MKSWESSCQVCGKLVSNWDMRELKSVYRIFPDLTKVCEKCGVKLDYHIDYYGKKKPKDKLAVRAILLSGVAVSQRHSALMNTGYLN